ncbi:MAG: hypothetical protein ABSA12_09145 [Verrucomicrobiia bacterium]
MHRIRRGCLTAGFLILVTLGPRSSEAQYTANFQTNIFNGTTNTVGTYLVGSNAFADVLLIRNKGLLTSTTGYVGYEIGSSNNCAIITGAGSMWNNLYGNLTIGYHGDGNSLIISNGGEVFQYDSSYITVGASSSWNRVVITGIGSVWKDNYTLYVGGASGQGNSVVVDNGGLLVSESTTIGGDSNNSVVVTGGGSVWSNLDLVVGYDGGGNSLVISNFAQLVNNQCTVGYLGGSSNVVRVVDSGVWQNGALIIGSQGSSNSVVVENGSLAAAKLVVGAASTTCDNVLELDSGNLVVANNGSGVLEVRNGQLILNGGVLQADTLVMTNACAQFIHTGGTLIVSNVLLDPNTFRITSITPQGNDMLITWMMGPGASNTLQATAGDGSGGYSANGFTDIFIVTNNTAVGTVTNYLDLGAATNTSSRYYRARLIP